MSLPYYRFFPGDYLRDTRFLSLTQHGAYHLLIHEYMNSGPLPNDMDRLYRIVGAQSVEERNAVEFVLTEFFLLRANRWTHARCDREIEHQAEKSQKARDSVNRRRDRQSDGSVGESLSESTNVGTNVDTNVDTNVPTNDVTNQNQYVGTTYLLKGSDSKTVPKSSKRRADGLPEWLPDAAWADWCAYRRTKGGWTAKAAELSLRTLTQLHDGGHDAVTVIETSIERGWRGLFPPTDHRPQAPPAGRPASKGAAFLAALDRTVQGVTDDDATAAGPARLGR